MWPQLPQGHRVGDADTYQTEVRGRDPVTYHCLRSQGSLTTSLHNWESQNVVRSGCERLPGPPTPPGSTPILWPPATPTSRCSWLRPPSKSHPPKSNYKAHNVSKTDLWRNSPTGWSHPGDNTGRRLTAATSSGPGPAAGASPPLQPTLHHSRHPRGTVAPPASPVGCQGVGFQYQAAETGFFSK